MPDLLAYLVRRLLENGANSCFVSVAPVNPSAESKPCCRRPPRWIHASRPAQIAIRAAARLSAPERRNSTGVEFGDSAALDALLAEIKAASPTAKAAPLIDGVAVAGRARSVVSPIDGKAIGIVEEGDEAIVAAAVAAAQAGFAPWSATPVSDRAAALERAGELIERNRGRLIALLQSEAGKTLDDCVSEVREAADYCRYYASQARRTLMPLALPGPTGESNELRCRGRGVVVCISPWNFPLAIFTGQVTAALAAGNRVVAKPSALSPLVAAGAVELLHPAGVPAGALHLVPGDRKVRRHAHRSRGCRR